MGTRIEQRSLLENNSSEEEESDLPNERKNHERQLNSKNVLKKEIVEKETECNSTPTKVGDLKNDHLTESTPIKNMIQFDEHRSIAKHVKNLTESLENQKDFLTIDLDEDLEFVANNSGDSFKENEILNIVNISNISNILNVSNMNAPSNSSKEEIINIASDDVELFSKKTFNSNQTI